MIELYGFFFILILGTLGHYIYELSGKSKIVGIFFAVNESTWEHMKLILGPAFLWAYIEYFFIGNNSNFIFAKFISIMVMMLFIPIFFYGYRRVLKKNNDILNILDFILAIAFGQYISNSILNLESAPNIINMLSLFGLIIMFSSYLLFTLEPLKLELFRDPITNKYGIE